jgi:hypothetical protein
MKQECGFLRGGFKRMGRVSVYIGAACTKTGAKKQMH